MELYCYRGWMLTNAWAETRYWYMSSLAKGREWIEERAKTRIHKSLICVESSRFQVQKDSLKDYRKEKLTPTEIRNNKMYLTELSHIRKLKE